MKPDETHEEELRSPSIWFSAAFLTMLAFVGLLSLIWRPAAISVTENRALTPMPEYTVWSLFSGSYTDSLDLYYADNFPFRESLVVAARTIRDLSGYRSELTYYQAEAVEPEVTLSAPDTLAAPKKDSVVAIRTPVDTVKAEPAYDRSSSIVIYNNRAIQLFTASTDGAEKYAAMVNLYQSTFDTLDIFCLIAPTQIDFYLPDEYKRSSNHEIKTINLVRDELDSLVHFVDAYAELNNHTDEYIYFNTDHHWTGRGAYYAYRAFCESAGLDPYPLDSLERKQVRRKFLGSLYGITLDKRLRETRDSLEYFKPRIATRTFRWNPDSSRYEFSKLFSNTHNYANFIGGDHPLVRIESDVNRNKILVIKDSFGNAVVPYLALHYGTVYVMDYRYHDANVRNFVRKNGITSIMFLHNTFAANSKYTAYRGRYVLNWRPAPKKQIEKTDSTNVDKTQDEASRP